MNVFEKARKFMYRSARPIELARWQYHFENGSKENVLTALAAFQNEDGGFGHGLEADSMNPHSSPITTWNACMILREIDWQEKSHPIVQGILRYLGSGKDFSEEHQQWMNTIPSNNDYPHAIWWGFKDESDYKYNPTAMLAGFILKFCEQGTVLYEKGVRIAKEAVAWFMEKVPQVDRHETACFVTLYEYLKETEPDIVDMEALAFALKTQVNANITRDTEKWQTEYVDKPSAFFIVPGSMFYEDNKEIASFECEFIQQTQLADGSFRVNWQWWNEYKEFEASKWVWKCVITLENMRYIKAFE
ncbi:MAG: hypothetical protein IKM05_01010 [Clostridia bacterium]|nr:hypothetical protein [Clostridia bacterium]